MIPAESEPVERVECAAYICGCRVTGVQAHPTRGIVYAGSGVQIEWCPLHVAAPEMLEALKRINGLRQDGLIVLNEAIQRLADGQPSTTLDWRSVRGWIISIGHACEAAIAKAEGR